MQTLTDTRARPNIEYCLWCDLINQTFSGPISMCQMCGNWNNIRHSFASQQWLLVNTIIQKHFIYDQF